MHHRWICAAAAAALACGGCFAELNGGYYKASTAGAIEEDAYQIGLAFGLFLEYSRFVRVVAAGDGQIGKADGDRVRPRSWGTQLRGDVTVVGTPKVRLRVTGAYHLPGGGDLAVETMPDVERTRTDATFGGWFIGPTLETTHLPTGVTQAFTIGPHVIDMAGDGVEPTRLRGVQLRIAHTFWPTWRSVSPGALGAFFNMMANNTVGGSGTMEAPSGGGARSCIMVRECTRGLFGEQCLTRQSC